MPPLPGQPPLYPYLPTPPLWPAKCTGESDGGKRRSLYVPRLFGGPRISPLTNPTAKNTLTAREGTSRVLEGVAAGRSDGDSEAEEDEDNETVCILFCCCCTYGDWECTKVEEGEMKGEVETGAERARAEGGWAGE